MGVQSDAIRFEPRPQTSNDARFLSVGRLVEKKGTEYAIRALGLLHSRRPALSWRYDIIGGGALMPSLVQLAKDLGIQDRVRFLGPKPHQEVIGYLSQADVFLHPCVTAEHGDMEACPIVLQEAMAAGLLAVSTHHSGIPELIDSGKSGFLVPERDTESLSRRLEDIADHPEAFDSVRREARAVIERHFNQTTLDDTLAELIIETAACRQRA
jgi:colanic acid/amylovoran biosynthesis glycosyltransferase